MALTMSLLYLLLVLAGLAFSASAAVAKKEVTLGTLLSLSPCIVHIVISFIAHIRQHIKWRRRRPPTRAGRYSQNSPCLLRAAKGSFQLLIQCWIFVVITGILSSDVHNLLFGTVTQASSLPVSTLTYLRSHSFQHPLPSTLHSKEPFLSDSHEHHAQTPTSSLQVNSSAFWPIPKGGQHSTIRKNNVFFIRTLRGSNPRPFRSIFWGIPKIGERIPWGSNSRPHGPYFI
jgi:hypothetical protein